MSSKPAWSMYWLLGQPVLHTESCILLKDMKLMRQHACYSAKLVPVSSCFICLALGSTPIFSVLPLCLRWQCYKEERALLRSDYNNIWKVFILPVPLPDHSLCFLLMDKDVICQLPDYIILPACCQAVTAIMDPSCLEPYGKINFIPWVASGHGITS